MTLKERIETTVGNMEVQGGQALWDDIEKMEHVLAMMIQGKSLEDEFGFVPDHFQVIENHFSKLKK